MTISAMLPNFTALRAVLSTLAVRIPAETTKKMIHISAEPNTTVGHPCRSREGKTAPTVSLSITA